MPHTPKIVSITIFENPVFEATDLIRVHFLFHNVYDSSPFGRNVSSTLLFQRSHPLLNIMVLNSCYFTERHVPKTNDACIRVYTEAFLSDRKATMKVLDVLHLTSRVIFLYEISDFSPYTFNRLFYLEARKPAEIRPL